MSIWIKAAIAVAAVAIIVVVFTAQRAASREAAWSQLAAARAGNFSVEALEDAREAAKGTDAEPWIVYRLTYSLYLEGTPADLERARQVASAAVQDYPDHALTPMLQDMLEKIGSFQTGS